MNQSPVSRHPQTAMQLAFSRAVQKLAGRTAPAPIPTPKPKKP